MAGSPSKRMRGPGGDWKRRPEIYRKEVSSMKLGRKRIRNIRRIENGQGPALHKSYQYLESEENQKEEWNNGRSTRRLRQEKW